MKPGKNKILVVDDSLTIRMQVKDMLENEGYQVMLAKDGETCLEILQKEIPDIILLDIVMPGISGLGVCRSIKTDEKLKNIPVLILTHVSDAENKVAGLNSGADDYVTKPFAIEELNARISAILRTKFLQQELILAKNAAEESALAKTSFLANMSHEIRTPMNGVIGFTELLLETELNHEQKEYVSTIKRSGDSLLVIINDILDFSKLESGDISFEEIEFNISQLLDDVTSLIKPKIGEKPVQISYSLDPDIPQIIKGDPHRLRQILINLLGNSAKFTERGEIASDVKLEKKEGTRIFLHFELKDTGIGILEDKLESIFELFAQADSSTTRKFGGTGLGLSISRKIAQNLGGNCWATSEAGRGSVFHVTGWFKTTAINNIQPKTSINNIGLNKAGFETNIKILLAEDNPVNQVLAKKIMEKMGNTVTVAGNGKIAVEMIKASAGCGQYDISGDVSGNASGERFDIIFMDMQMPEMDGVQATKEIRKLEKERKVQGENPMPRIPVIAMTANVLEEHRRQCFEAGMDDFIPKPIKKEIIFEMIRKFVRLS